ncbi:MAG: hypothetical protein PHQ40_16360 [Anaerolineaceae bacterium]|nr:hypothetical protein [Anaerolineaceae bacterium]
MASPADVPLALELAAAHARLLSLPEIQARLQTGLSGFQLLSTGSGDLPPRQQTLLAAIRWSTDLLTVAERGLFNRLAIFAGGSLALALSIDDQETIAYSLEGLADCRTRAATVLPSDRATALRLSATRWLGAAGAVRARLALPIPPGESEHITHLRSTLKSALPEEALAAALEAGRILPLSQVALEALEGGKPEESG